MSSTSAKSSVDALAVALCLGAAASASVTAALVTVSAGAIVLLLTGLVLSLLRMKAGTARTAAALLFALALSASVQMWLNAARSAWVPDGFTLSLLGAALLFCGPAAARMLDTPPEAGLGRTLVFALALPVIGGIRELLAAGSLMGVRLLPDAFPVSISFAGGAAGLVAAGLLMALFGLRFRGMVRLTPRDGVRAGIAVGLTAIPAAMLYLLAARMIPLPTWGYPLFAPLSAALFAGVWSAVCPQGRLKPLFGESWIPALVTLFLLGADSLSGGGGNGWAFGGTALAAAGLGLGVSLAAALLGKIENIHLPHAFRTAPAALTAAGLALLAFQVVRL